MAELWQPFCVAVQYTQVKSLLKKKKEYWESRSYNSKTVLKVSGKAIVFKTGNSRCQWLLNSYSSAKDKFRKWICFIYKTLHSLPLYNIPI